MNLILTTDRLVLTPLTLADIDSSIELWTDPAVTKYICDEVSEDEIREEMPLVVKRGGNGCIGIWCISDRRTSEKYGEAYLLPMPVEEDDNDWDLVVPGTIPDCDIEVGYFLKPSAWGKGFATEVCKRLIRCAFEETTLNEVVASVDAGNKNSMNVLEKSGMHHGGITMAYGKNGPIFRISRKEWTDPEQR